MIVPVLLKAKFDGGLENEKETALPSIACNDIFVNCKTKRGEQINRFQRKLGS